MMRTRALILTTAAVALLAAPSFAQQTQNQAPDPDAPTATARKASAQPPPGTVLPPLHTTPQAQDPAKDNAPTETVAVPRRQQLFISPMGEPFRADFGQAYPVETWFKGMDKRGDGQVTLQEFRADAERFFKVLDANGDGVIDGFEVGDYESKVAPEILPRVQDQLNAQDVMTDKELAQSGHRRRRPEDSAGGRGREKEGTLTDAMTGAAQYGLLAEPEPVRGSDGNLDFRITHDEWMSAASRRFDELDKKHAGKLTLPDLPITPMQRLLIDRAKQEAKHKKP